MNRIYLIVFFVLILSGSVCAQENLQIDNYRELSNQVATVKTVDDIEQIISKAEDTFKIDKKQFDGNLKKEARITLNFALFRKSVHQNLNTQISFIRVVSGDGPEFLKLYKKNYKKLEQLLERTIEIYEISLKVENNYLAIAKFELANSLENYRYRNKSSSTWKKRIEKLNRIQDLYSQAILFWEKTLGESNNTARNTNLNLANSYLVSADFEKALNYYEKYILITSEIYGRNSEFLLPALRSSAAIWNMIGRTNEIEKYKKQVAEITNQDKGLSVALLPIILRAKSFKYQGLRRMSLGITGLAPVGVVREGRTNQARNSINTPINSRLSDPVYTNLIGMGQTKFVGARSVKVFVTVNIEGNVNIAKAETDDAKLKLKIEGEVKKWEFEPFVHEGKKVEMKGLIYYQVRVTKNL